MKTLLQLNCTSNWGSTGKIAEQIGLKAKEAGWESWIAYGRSANPSQLNIIKVGNMFSVYEHYAENRLLDREGLASRIPTQRLVKKIKEIKPDVVHLHNIHDHWLNYPTLFKCLKVLDVPVVWTFHDCWAFTGHCAHFVTVNCDKWKTGCSKCPLTKEYPKSFIDQSLRNYRLKQSLFIKNPNLHIITVSDWLAGLVKKSFFKKSAIRVIANGLNLSTFNIVKKFNNNSFDQTKFLIVGVATTWSKDKGLYDYIELSKHLAEDELIVLVGVDDNTKKGMPFNIIGLSRTKNQHELAELYSRADVVTSLSYAETFGLTIAEGFACGTPGIVYNNTAQPELITSDTGIVVEQGNITALYAAIKTIRAKGKKQYSANCRKRAEDFFNKDDRFQDYIKLYEELLKNKK